LLRQRTAAPSDPAGAAGAADAGRYVVPFGG